MAGPANSRFHRKGAARPGQWDLHGAPEHPPGGNFQAGPAFATRTWTRFPLWDRTSAVGPSSRQTRDCRRASNTWGLPPGGSRRGLGLGRPHLLQQLPG